MSPGGNACRYADEFGVIQDAVITEIVSTLSHIVNLSYSQGEHMARNGPSSRDPAIAYWGCADTGSLRTWRQSKRVAGGPTYDDRTG